MFSLDPSDVALIIDFLLAVNFMLMFALGKPRTWHRDRLGWVIFGYAAAVVALLSLIVYAVVFDEKVDEPWRLLVSGSLGIALIAKTWAVHKERREGRLAGDRHPIERTGTMSFSEPPATDLVKSATEIWYKAQRVLRTLVAVVIPAFLGFAVLLPQIIEALGLPVDSELRLWLLAVAAGVSAVAAAITRIMAIPAVNAWLIKIGLGSVPRSAVAVETNNITGEKNVYVMEDPKAHSRA